MIIWMQQNKLCVYVSEIDNKKANRLSNVFGKINYKIQVGVNSIYIKSIETKNE